MTEPIVVQFTEDLRRLSKITPEVRQQMRELDLAYGGLTSHANGYADEAPYMLYMIENDKLRGKLEYSFNAGDASAVIIWLNAPGYGNAMLAEFEQRLLEIMPRCTILLICSLDPGERNETVLTRLNFYFRHGFRAQRIEYKPTPCVHLTLCKTIERQHSDVVMK